MRRAVKIVGEFEKANEVPKNLQHVKETDKHSWKPRLLTTTIQL